MTTKEEILNLLDEVTESVDVCCAITMDPDSVLEKIEKIKSLINKT